MTTLAEIYLQIDDKPRFLLGAVDQRSPKAPRLIAAVLRDAAERLEQE